MNRPIPALTVCQPYAELIASGVKPIENRTWRTDYQGPLFIHAGKSLAWLDDKSDKDKFVFGAIVAVVRMVACLSVDRSDWHRWESLREHEHANGPYCFVLEDIHRLKEPVRCNGAQGFWVPSADITQACLSQIPTHRNQEE